MCSHCRCGVGVTANLPTKKKKGASCTGRESIQSSILHLDWVMLTTFLFFYKCQHPLEWSVRLFLWQPQNGDQWGLCVYLAWHLKSLLSSENNVLGSWQMQMMWWCFMATRHVWGSRNKSEFRRDERWKGDNSDWPETNRPYLRWHRCRREGREERPPL